MSDFNYYSKTMEMISSRICHDIVGPVNTIENCQAMIDESLLLKLSDKHQSQVSQSPANTPKIDEHDKSKHLNEPKQNLELETKDNNTLRDSQIRDSNEFSEGGQIDEGVINIMREAISISSNRIKFYRLTFGQGGHSGLGSNHLLELITSYLKNTNVSLNFSSIINREDWPNGWGKLCLIGCYHAFLFAQRGGDINLKFTKLENSNKFVLIIKAISEKLLINDQIIEFLEREDLPEIQQLSTNTIPSFYLNLLLKNYNRKLTITTHENKITLEII